MKNIFNRIICLSIIITMIITSTSTSYASIVTYNTEDFMEVTVYDSEGNEIVIHYKETPNSITAKQIDKKNNLIMTAKYDKKNNILTSSENKKIRVESSKVRNDLEHKKLELSLSNTKHIDANLTFMKTLTYQMSSNRIPVYLKTASNEAYSSQFYFDKDKHKVAIGQHLNETIYEPASPFQTINTERFSDMCYISMYGFPTDPELIY